MRQLLMFRWLSRRRSEPVLTRAAQLAADDALAAKSGARFGHGTRPLVRWNIAAGQDGQLLREAIFLTTAALGDEFDYALCSSGISALRVREMLELSTQPVEWRTDWNAPLDPLRPAASELVLPYNFAVPEQANPWLRSWVQSRIPWRHEELPLAALTPAGEEIHEAQIFSNEDMRSFAILQSAPPRPAPDLVQRFTWLASFGQWGVPGWSMPDALTRLVIGHAAAFAGRRVLELGTSRGRLSAMLAALGCSVVTVDHQDRGARANLEGLAVEVIQQDLVAYLERASAPFDLVVCDLHGNAPADWQRYRKPLLRSVARGGTLILNNAALHRLEGWETETGVPWFVSHLPRNYVAELHTEVLPGIAVIRRK